MDLRVERTKRSIINAFIELRAQKPIEKITVKELSELAYINKATFYSHYHDIYDLSEHLETEIITSVLKNIPHPDSLITKPKQAVSELMLALTSQNKLFGTIFSGSRESIFQKKLETKMKEHIYMQYPEYRNNLSWDIALSVMIHGCFNAFLSHSDADINDVVRVLGEINECLTNKFLLN